MTYGFDPSQGLIIVPVRLFGPAGDMIVRLALDTGATSTLITSEIMVLLGSPKIDQLPVHCFCSTDFPSD